MTLSYVNAAPAPRPSIAQGINPDDPIVVSHNQIYSALMEQVTSSHTQDNALVFLDPFTTSPLSFYIGIWSDASDTATISVSDVNGNFPVMTFTQPVVAGANLIPAAGLLPGIQNKVTVMSASGSTLLPLIETAPLPPTDADVSDPTDPANYNLFPQITVNSLAADESLLADGLYFISYFDRNNLALDNKGNVRWYTVKSMPSNNLLRLANGHFVSSAVAQSGYLKMYEFDMVGRVHAIYDLDNAFHHSLYQQSSAYAYKGVNNCLVAASEYMPGTRPDGGLSIEDGVSIISLETGEEIDYYDMVQVLGLSRSSRPSNPPDTAGGTLDWLHINQAYINETNNMLITSGRNQSVVFGLKVGTYDLSFIMGTHSDWPDELSRYLLTPLRADGTPYDLTDPQQAQEADAVFWNWGQHNVLEIPNATPGIIDISLFNNSNYRSRSDANSVLPQDNESRIGHYRINLNTMTVQMLAEYASGPEGYSSLCGCKQEMANGNIVVSYGGALFDSNGLPLTCDPGYSDLAFESGNGDVEGRLPLREMNADGVVLQDFTIGSGLYRNINNTPAGNVGIYRYNITCFRMYKLPLFG